MPAQHGVMRQLGLAYIYFMTDGEFIFTPCSHLKVWSVSPEEIAGEILEKERAREGVRCSERLEGRQAAVTVINYRCSLK